MMSAFEAIPVGALLGAVLACPLYRRSRFWLRFALVLIALVLPDLVAFFAPVSGQAALMLVFLGCGWGLALLAPSRFVLFQGHGPDPEPGDDGGGSGPEGGRPTPPAPIGGVPLLDAEPWSTRLRECQPRGRRTRSRRRVSEPERSPSRSRPVRL